jgi:hypothetical protein
LRPPPPIDLTNTNLATLSFASLDRTADVDFYRLIVPPSRRITITVTPVGGVYQVGGEDGNPSQSTIDTRAIQNLQLELLAPNGTTILASATANGVGQAEQIANFVLYPAGGNFYRARVLRHRLHERCAAVRAAHADREPCPQAMWTATAAWMTPTCWQSCSTSAVHDPRYDLTRRWHRSTTPTC